MGIIEYEVECPCGMLLEIGEQTIVECPDCGRQLDNKGNVQD